MKVDILKMEIEQKLPYWLSPEAKFADKREKIRAKHRARHEQALKQKQKAKRKAKAG